MKIFRRIRFSLGSRISISNSWENAINRPACCYFTQIIIQQAYSSLDRYTQGRPVRVKHDTLIHHGQRREAKKRKRTKIEGI